MKVSIFMTKFRRSFLRSLFLRFCSIICPFNVCNADFASVSMGVVHKGFHIWCSFCIYISFDI